MTEEGLGVASASPPQPEADVAANHHATEFLNIVTARAADFSRKAAEGLYVCLLETAQDYLIDNARYNIGQRIAAADRQSRQYREALAAAEARSRVLFGALQDAYAFISAPQYMDMPEGAANIVTYRAEDYNALTASLHAAIARAGRS